MIKYVYCLFLLMGIIHGYAQSCDIVFSGHITDIDNSEALDYATVYLLELGKGATANEKGEFVLDKLCPGKYTVRIAHLGCKDSLFKIDLSKPVHLHFYLPHSYNELSEVSVKEKFQEIHTQAHNELTGAEMSKAMGQSLGEALKQLSGLTSLNTGSTISKPMIHGLQGYRVLILNNGIRQEGQQWGNEHAPEIDPFIATKLSVIKGAGAMRYGCDAIGGVILVEPGDLPDTASLTGEVNLVGFSNGRQGVASGILQGCFNKIKGFNWRVQGTVKQGGNTQTPRYYLNNTAIKEQNFSYALGYHRKNWGTEFFYSQFNTQIGIFSGSHIGNLSDLQNAFQQHKPNDSLAPFSYAITRPSQNISHELVKSIFHLHTGLRSRLHLNMAWQYNLRQEFDKHLFYNQNLSDSLKNSPQLDYRITSKTAELLWEHDNVRSFRGQYGFSYMHQGNVYLGRFFIPNYRNNTWGLFANERLIKTNWEFELGLRYDEKYLLSFFYEKNTLQKPSLAFKNMSGNTGVVYKVAKGFNLMFNLGSSWRAPAVNELYANGLHHGAAAIERGDKNLKTERGYNAILTAIIKQKQWNAEASTYYNLINNFIYQNPGQYPELTIKGAFPVFNYKQANVIINGFDLKVNYLTPSGFQFENKLMLIYGYNKTINNYLIYMPANRGELTLQYNFKPLPKLKEAYLSATLQYVAKQWRIPAGIDFAPPPEAYGLINANANATFLWGKQSIVLGITFTNLTNVVYRDYLDRFRYYCDAMGRNIQLRLKIPIQFYKGNITP